MLTAGDLPSQDSSPHMDPGTPLSMTISRGWKEEGMISSLGKAGACYLDKLLPRGARPSLDGGRHRMALLMLDICILSSSIIFLGFLYADIWRLLSVHQTTS